MSELVEAARGRGRDLRFWSAGCATGEEAYSLAIVAAAVLREELDSFTVRVFATALEQLKPLVRRASSANFTRSLPAFVR